MDVKNPFETPTTFKLNRAEWLAAFAVTNVLMVWHWHDIRWLWALVLFAYIDVLGYFPGAIAFRRSPNGRVHKFYYANYNFFHSLITQGIMVALWGYFVRWEWALLAIGWHIFGDRGVFGNSMKTFRLPFEPHPHPAYQRLIETIQADSSTAEVPPVPVSEEADSSEADSSTAEVPPVPVSAAATRR